jgi:hypothetical protein
MAQGRSKPSPLINDVDQRLAHGEATAVLEEGRFPFLTKGRAKDRDVRRDQHARHLP